MTESMASLIGCQLVRVTLGDDTGFALALDDRVYPDRTCGQWTAGYFAFRPGTEDNPDAPSYFVEEGGRVYGEDVDGDVREFIGTWEVVS